VPNEHECNFIKHRDGIAYFYMQLFVRTDYVARIATGDKVALLYQGEALLARIAESYMITEDGQRISDDEFEELKALGKVTYKIVAFGMMAVRFRRYTGILQGEKEREKPVDGA